MVGSSTALRKLAGGSLQQEWVASCIRPTQDCSLNSCEKSNFTNSLLSFTPPTRKISMVAFLIAHDLKKVWVHITMYTAKLDFYNVEMFIFSKCKTFLKFQNSMHCKVHKMLLTVSQMHNPKWKHEIPSTWWQVCFKSCLVLRLVYSSNQNTQATVSWALIVYQILINLLKLSSIFFLKSPYWNGSICTVQTKYTWF